MDISATPQIVEAPCRHSHAAVSKRTCGWQTPMEMLDFGHGELLKLRALVFRAEGKASFSKVSHTPLPAFVSVNRVLFDGGTPALGLVESESSKHGTPNMAWLLVGFPLYKPPLIKENLSHSPLPSRRGSLAQGRVPMHSCRQVSLTAIQRYAVFVSNLQEPISWLASFRLLLKPIKRKWVFQGTTDSSDAGNSRRFLFTPAFSQWSFIGPQ